MRGAAAVVAAAFGTLVALTGTSAPAQPVACPGLTPWSFADVAASDPFCAAVTFMATSGVSTGCQIVDASNRLFCPDALVTRRQMAAFLSRLASGAVFAQGGNAFGATGVLGTSDGQALELRVQGSRALRLEPHPISPNVIGGGPANVVDAAAYGATVGGGGAPLAGDPNVAEGGPNRVTARYGTVAGGYANIAGDAGGNPLDAVGNVVGGGSRNRSSSYWSTVAGGDRNTASGTYGSVGGGVQNTASGSSSTVGGGNFNSASQQGATVAGGLGNAAGGEASTVPGGYNNAASGNYSFAAGVRAKAVHPNSFVWNGALFADTATLAAGDFIVYAPTPGRVRLYAGDYGSGGCEIGTGNVGGNLTCQGVITAAAFVPPSDRALKAGVVPVRPSGVLERVLALPIAEWSYTSSPGVRHMGPMGQDFHAAFGLGATDKGIATVDADGVALAAIQGLDAKLAERERALRAELRAKDAELDALRARLAELARAVETLTALVAPPPVAAR